MKKKEGKILISRREEKKLDEHDNKHKEIKLITMNLRNLNLRI